LNFNLKCGYAHTGASNHKPGFVGDRVIQFLYRTDGHFGGN
jgi:hypothetical protein